MTQFYEGFEVKTGKNKGFYIAVHETDSELKELLRRNQWGCLDLIQNLDFYKAHGLYKESWTSFYEIWTHPRFGGHELYREAWTNIKIKLSKVLRNQTL